MILTELTRIRSVFEEAIDCIREGDLKRATRLSNSIKKSFAVSEAQGAVAVIEGYALYTRKKKTQGKRRCLESICYLWDDPDALFLIRQPHPQPGEAAQWYEISICGGLASMGCFTQFTKEHRCSFLVLAHDEFEAVRYIDELANYAAPEERQITVLGTASLRPDQDYDQCGVYRSSPFSREEVSELQFISGTEVRL